MKGDNKKQQYRINEQIRVHEVRIVGEDVESAVMSTRDDSILYDFQWFDSFSSHQNYY